MRLLFLIADGYPIYRPDVTVLFGKYLPEHGVFSDLVTQRNADNGSDAGWGAGELLLGRRYSSRARNQLAQLAHDVVTLWRAPGARYDAIQVRDKVFAAIAGMWKARRLDVPFFYWMSYPMNEHFIELADRHGLSLGVVRYLFIKIRSHVSQWLLHRYVLPNASHVFVQSERMRSDVVALGIEPDRLTAVPMCIDPDRFEHLDVGAADVPEFRGRRVIVYLGNCGQSRRVDFLIDVAEMLRAREPNILLLLVGDAAEEIEREWLRRYISSRGLETHVTVTGWLPPERAQQYAMRAEVALALMPPDPLLDSTSPTKLIEYLAMGRPVVANEHPDQATVIRESGAGICVPFDREAFAGAIETILSDPGLAARFSADARTYAFSARNYRIMAANLASTYKRLAHRAQRP